MAPTGSGLVAAVTLGWVAATYTARTTPRGRPGVVAGNAHAGRAGRQRRRGVVRQACGRIRPYRPLDPVGEHPRAHGRVEDDHWLDSPQHPAVLVGTQSVLRR